jgi:hypothetical protein
MGSERAIHPPELTLTKRNKKNFANFVAIFAQTERKRCVCDGVVTQHKVVARRAHSRILDAVRAFAPVRICVAKRSKTALSTPGDRIIHTANVRNTRICRTSISIIAKTSKKNNRILDIINEQFSKQRQNKKLYDGGWA